MPTPRSAAVTGAAVAAGAVFGVAARVRRAKPIHPSGAVLAARVHLRGASSHWGAPWLDDVLEIEGVVRISRSAGLPHPAPDVVGLALRLPIGSGAVGDLLLSTCVGRGPISRRLLAPRFSAAVAYSSLLAYRTTTGPAMVLAEPDDLRALPASPEQIAEAVSEAPFRFTLSVARPLGSWEHFGSVDIGETVAANLDPPISFDPVRNAPPGLSLYEPMASIRGRSYASARRNRPNGDEPVEESRVLTSEQS